MLSRINHPNIIRLIGAGQHPRRFIVLEWLGGKSSVPDQYQQPLF